LSALLLEVDTDALNRVPIPHVLLLTAQVTVLPLALIDLGSVRLTENVHTPFFTLPTVVKTLPYIALVRASASFGAMVRALFEPFQSDTQ